MLIFSPPSPTIGQPFSVTCSVTTDPAASAQINTTWIGPSGVVEQTTGTTAVNLTLEFDPFTAQDLQELEQYRCTSVIASPMFPGLTIGLQNTINTERELLIYCMLCARMYCQSSLLYYSLSLT